MDRPPSAASRTIRTLPVCISKSLAFIAHEGNGTGTDVQARARFDSSARAEHCERARGLVARVYDRPRPQRQHIHRTTAHHLPGFTPRSSRGCSLLRGVRRAIRAFSLDAPDGSHLASDGRYGAGASGSDAVVPVAAREGHACGAGRNYPSVRGSRGHDHSAEVIRGTTPGSQTRWVTSSAKTREDSLSYSANQHGSIRSRITTRSRAVFSAARRRLFGPNSSSTTRGSMALVGLPMRDTSVTTECSALTSLSLLLFSQPSVTSLGMGPLVRGQGFLPLSTQAQTFLRVQ